MTDVVERLIQLRDMMTDRRDRDVLADACNEIDRLRDANASLLRELQRWGQASAEEF